MSSLLLTTLSEALDSFARTIDVPVRNVGFVVGVSGGPDSLAMLHALRQLVPPENLVVAHLDHQLRPESAVEARYVGETAKSWGLTYVDDKVNVRELSQATKLSVEEAARQARYTFLAATVRMTGAAAVITGHHADDQAETVLMHLLRGSGLTGLRGMLPVTHLPDEPDIWLLRPMLGISRQTIDAYCEAHALNPVLDASNTDRTYFRNRLRHELLPFLETYNPEIRERLQSLSAVAAADVDFLKAQTADAYNRVVTDRGPGWVLLDRESWRALHLSLRRGTLRMAIEHTVPNQRDIGFVTLEAAREMSEDDSNGKQARLPGGCNLYVNSDTLLLSVQDGFPPSLGPQLVDASPVALPVPGSLKLANDWVLSTEWVEDYYTPNDNDVDLWSVTVAMTGSTGLIVRGRDAGERMQPFGLNGHSASIKRLMIDRKIPAPLRQLWPIVACVDHPVWLVGQTIDYRNRITPAGGNVIKIRCTPPDLSE